jgi:hypothetical protein
VIRSHLDRWIELNLWQFSWAADLPTVIDLCLPVHEIRGSKLLIVYWLNCHMSCLHVMIRFNKALAFRAPRIFALEKHPDSIRSAANRMTQTSSRTESNLLPRPWQDLAHCYLKAREQDFKIVFNRVPLPVWNSDLAESSAAPRSTLLNQDTKSRIGLTQNVPTAEFMMR